MEKLPQREVLKKTSVFLVNPEIEEVYKRKVYSKVCSMRNMLQKINYKEGLIECISQNKDALELIIILLGISKEKFKRIVSWIRMSFGYTFDSEWEYTAIRENFRNNAKFRDILCELLLNGRNSEQFKDIIPQYILEEFVIDSDVIARLSSYDFLASLVKAKLNTEYNNYYCTYYRSLVEKQVADICTANHYSYTLNVLANTICKGISSTERFSVIQIEKNGRKIVIAPHFYMTTSSSQTDFAKNVIHPLYTFLRDNNDILICMLDGAGWVGRPADYSRIYSASHYFINLKTIDSLKTIIKNL